MHILRLTPDLLSQIIWGLGLEICVFLRSTPGDSDVYKVENHWFKLKKLGMGTLFDWKPLIFASIIYFFHPWDGEDISRADILDQVT